MDNYGEGKVLTASDSQVNSVSGQMIFESILEDGVFRQLERIGKRVFAWNTDAWGYGRELHPCLSLILGRYCSSGWEALGVLHDTTLRCEIDLRKESVIQFIAPSSYLVITFGPFAR
ncbi:hypothetical protein K2173_018830 [Erythroxylum novogranatense]|uniref:Uncharacterized protein n=1 Tax=Erythroxylum novogranatense TaxID=1862640 RepID=A0AAV8T2J0_9ROSI|nr:hypothetical protein K2173_018830 [Erythroxylum novogranatense]